MLKDKLNLYFIALIPNLQLREEIKALKEEMKDRFNAKHALKSPAHITLQMPFKKSKKDEASLILALQQFAKEQQTFKVELSGFDCFEPRVIYINPINNNPIPKLHSSLKNVMLKKLHFAKDEVTTKIHPHITIATRDLNENMFYLAWNEFKKRTFKASFEVNSIFLLKHNGKFWDIYMEFLFNK